MDFEVIRASDLTSTHIGAWRAAQSACGDNASPFFSPEYAQAVDSARGDVLVAILREGGDATGVFPFHRRNASIGVPVGGPITDYQGVIGPANTRVDPAALLAACQLGAYDFNHLPATHTGFAQGSIVTADSPYLDLSDGYEAYVSARAAAGTKELKNTARKRRKIEREIGPLRFVANDASPEAWAAFVRWKNSSYERLGVRSIIDLEWVSRTLETIRQTDSPEFSGMLSTLYVGDRLAAAHFGICTRKACHWWFPTYDSDLHKYSPGLALLLELAAHCAARGIEHIDLGRGDERYKTAFASGATVLCEGSIEAGAGLPALVRRTRKLLHRGYARMPVDIGFDFQRRAFNRVLGVGRL